MDLRIISIMLLAIVVVTISPHAYADSSKSWKVIIKGVQVDKNSTYWPPEIQARKSQTIEWINADSISHSVTSGLPNHPDYAGKIFDSGIIPPGGEFSFTIPKGAWSAYYYFDRMDPNMTGKIDAVDSYLGKTPVFDIKTNSSSYKDGETIQIEGNVNDTYQKTPLTLQIFDQDRNLVFLETIKVPKNNHYVYKMPASSSIFKNSGVYKIKAFYGFPSTVTDANFFFTIVPQKDSITDYTVPNWVKNDAMLWSDKQISDSEFTNAIQYLIKNNIIESPHLPTSESSAHYIPSWIRDTAKFWAQGKISDKDFILGIGYLIEQGQIKI